MDILRNHPDQLILEQHPVSTHIFNVLFLIGFMCLGAFLIRNGITHGWYLILAGLLIPSVILMRMTLRTDIIFDRTADRLTINRKHLRRMRRDIHPLQDLLQASIEVSNFGRNHSETFRCQLDMANGEVIFLTSDLYTQKKHPQKIVGTINTWLNPT